MTTEEAFMQYINYKKSIGIRNSTIENNLYRWKSYIKPVIGTLEISTIDNKLILDHFAIWNKNVPAPTVLSIKKILAAFFKFLIEEEIIAKNPISRIKLAPYHAERLILTKNQLKYLLEKAKDKWFYPHLHILAITGVRHGEMSGLQWNDINFDNKTITIKRSYRNGVTSDVKTKNSYRTIDISDNLIATLIKQKKKVDKQFAGECIWVLPSKKGVPLSQCCFNYNVAKFLKELDLPHVVIHSFRHLHATTLLENNVPVPAIKERLGWASAAMLYDTYAHTTFKQRTMILNTIDDL